MVNYGTSSVRSLIYSLVRIADPVIAVELGVHQADSLLLIASAMRPSATIYGFDTFGRVQEALPCTKFASSKELAEKIVSNEYERLRRENIERGTDRVLPHIYIVDSDYVKAASSVAFTSFLHVNACNHEQSVREILKAWIGKVDDLIILEGGRINDWQRSHKLRPFEHVLDETWIREEWRSIVIDINENESLSILTRR